MRPNDGHTHVMFDHACSLADKGTMRVNCFFSLRGFYLQVEQPLVAYLGLLLKRTRHLGPTRRFFYHCCLSTLVRSSHAWYDMHVHICRGPQREPRYTVCVSSQVGCAMNCQFCYTGRLGLMANLQAAQVGGASRADICCCRCCCFFFCLSYMMLLFAFPPMKTLLKLRHHATLATSVVTALLLQTVVAYHTAVLLSEWVARRLEHVR